MASEIFTQCFGLEGRFYGAGLLRPGARKVAVMSEEKGPFSAAPERPLNDWLIALARDRARDGKISYGAALSQVLKENPRLAEAARMETTGGQDGQHSAKFLQLMQRALEIAEKSKSLTTEEALERAAVQNPELARAARDERGGSLYAGELLPVPGVGSKSVLMSEGVEAALDPSNFLVMLASERRNQKGISFREALCEVGREHPELTHAAREQTMGCNLS